MAQDNPFLKSPFDDIGTDDSGLLPGQQAVRPAPKAAKQEARPVDVDAPDAPAAPVRRASPTKDDVIARAEAHGVDPALALSIWSQESGANWNSKDSPKGARGGMQVMPATFRAMMGNANQRDPWNNLEAGLKYIAYGQKTLGTKDPALLAAGYHSGYDRDSLKAGIIPNVSDGKKNTRDYAREVAARAGGQAKVVSDSPDDMSRFVPLSEEEAATYAQSGELDASRFVALTDDEVKQLGAQTAANPFEAPKEQGFFSRVGDAFGEGVDNTMQSLGTARFVMGGGDSTQLARDLATKFATQQAKPKTEGQKEIDAAFQRVTDAKGAWDTIKAGAGAIGTAISNPKDLAVEIAGQAPNMLPSLAGGAAGAGAGAAAGAGGALIAGQLGPQVATPEEVVTVPVAAAGGAIWGGRAGMVAGTTATELGAEVEQMIQERLQASKAAPTEANIKAMLDDDKFRSEARSRGLKKGLTVAVIDQIFMGLGGKVASKAASAGTKAGKVALGAGAVATDATGEVVGEAASQKVARGHVDMGDALREGVMGLGQSVVEPAVGAGMRAAKGAVNAARPAPAAPAPRVEPTLDAPQAAPTPAPAPAAPSGPLSGSLEAVAEQDAGESARVTVTAPSGEQASGTVLESQEDGEGNFVTQIMGDDGQVYTFSSEDGVQITPEATPDAGPLSASLTAAAEAHDAQAPAAEPAPAEAPAEPAAEIAEQPAAEPTPAAETVEAAAPAAAEPVSAPQVEEAAPPLPAPQSMEQQYAAMDEPALRERLKYIADQAKASGGWNPMFMKARKAVEKEIAKRKAGQPPVVTETTAEVQNVGGENSVNGDPVDRGSAGPVPDGAVAESRADGAANAGPAADAQPALKDAHAGKWFSSREKADAYVAKKNAGETHQVEQTGKVRFEVKPKAVTTEAVASTTEAAPAASQEAPVVAEQAAPADSEPVARKAPWQMSGKEWAKERDAVRPNVAQSNFTSSSASEAVRSHERLQELLFGARDAARQRLEDAKAGKVKLSRDEVDDLLDQVNTPISHKDVVAKAVAEGMPVPPEVLAEYPEIGQSDAKRAAEAVPAEVPAKPAKKKPGKKAAAERAQQLADHFTPGNVVKGYAGHDRVLEYTPDEDGGFTVKVQHVVREGDQWVVAPGVDGRERTHSTMPNDRELKAGPVERAPAQDDQVADTKPEAEEAPAADAAPGPQSAADWSERMAELRKVKPRPLEKMYGENPTDEQRASHAAIEKQWNRDYRHATKMQKEALVLDNAAFHARQDEIAKQKTATSEKRQPEPKDQPAAEQPAPASTIGDFGEKIHGARKDVWTGFREDMSAALPDDVKEITLAKHFPEPNYDALIEAGVDPKVLAALKAMRDDIPAKPRMPFKAKRWGEQVTILRDFANKLLDGTQSLDELLREMRRAGALSKFAERIEMYAALGYPLFRQAKGYTLEKHHYTMFRGETPPGGITKWELSGEKMRSDYFDTQEQGVEALRTRLESLSGQAPEGSGKAVQLDLYRTSSGDIIIGKKVAAGKFIDLKTGFTNVKEARAYLADHRDELLALLEKKKDVRPERRTVNAPRVGEDRRLGDDIAPEQFGETFGFRGVQFGNYVEQKRRAADLNNAYDALLDMAQIIGVPAKAISLNGTLGLAFGARGKGGKNPAAAHYEPGHVVINLTKTNGAGSLGHEWWHGLDNYFAKMRGQGGDFITMSPKPRMVPNAERKMVPDESVRPEALSAFKGVVDAIRDSGMVKRSRELDGRRTKDYWSTIEELTARAFESYLIDKAAEKGHSNDYLANIVSEDAHNAMNGLTGLEEPFPYPTRAEAPAINAAFDRLFETLETKEEDGKVALYSVQDGVTQAEFGPVHTEYRDDPAGAVERLLADKDGEAIVDVPGLGDVSLIYGDEKTGLGHIARRRGAEFMERLPALLKDGTLYGKPGQKDRVFLGNDRDEAVVRFEWDGQAKTWLLSAYEKYPDGVKLSGPVQQQSRRSETVAERTGAAGATLTAKSLRRALNKGVLGPVIDSMVEAGVVVLHNGPKTLPKGRNKKSVGAGIDGVQAVTMPDGTIHMVASNLSARNARAVMLHEVFHQGGEAFLGSKQWADLMGRLGSLYRQAEQSNGKAREFYDRARERVAKAKKKGAVATRMEVEEFAAYAIEEYETSREGMPSAIRKWVEDMIGMVKAWVQKRYGRQLGAVTPAQLAALAKFAVLDVAAARRGEIFGPVGEMFSTTGEPGGVSAFNESMEAKYPGLRFDLMEKRNGDLHLSRIVVPMGSREQGTGTKFMEDLAAFADEQGKRIVLTASGDFGGTAARLTKFYKRFGFVENKGKNKDFSTMEGMYRDPAEGARFSVAAGTSSTTAATTPPAEPPSYAPPEQGLLRRVQAAIQDNQNRLKQVQDKILEVTGRTTLGKADHYGAETNRPGRIAARLEDARDHLTGPLMERLAKSGYTPKQLSELLHAQHAEERNAAVAKINPDMPDGGSGMTNDQAQAILTNYAAATELHEMAKQARAIAKATLDLKLAYGLIKPEDHELLGSMYENYVPLKGDGEYGPKIKRAMGHEEREEHILENIARDYDQAVVVGEKNLARQSLLRMVLQFPDEALWTARVPPRGRYVAGRSFSVERNGKSEAVFTSQAQVAAFLEAKGVEATQYTVLDSAGERVVEFMKPLQDNEVLVYVNGDPVRIQIMDEVLARQLRPLDQARMNPILEFMRGMNRWLSKVYTGYNPAFILRNAARDAMTGTINMMGNQGTAVAAKAWTKYPKAAATLAVWAKTKKAPDTKFGRYLTEYRMHGGKVGASYMSDLEEQGSTLQEMYDNARGLAATARDGSIKRTSAVAWNKTVGRLAHVIEVINQATENALRLSLFIALREEGLSPGKAAQAAKTVTVDFDRKGTQTGALGAIYLFFNPAIQGVTNGFKTLAKGDHKKQAWAALGGLALAGAFAASAGMGDDPDRWLGETFETRTKNLMLSIGGYQFRAPLSQEFAPAYALGVALTEAMHGEDKMKTAVRIVSSFIDAYFPLQGAFKPDSDNPLGDLQLAATPTLFKPIAEAAMNRNSFGSQVVPENEMTKDRPDNLKMNRGTKGTPYDAVAQGIASFGEMMGAGKYENDLTKVSPETIKSLWRNYTGGLGAFITDTIGVASITASAPGEVERTEVPIVKDFVKARDVKAIRGRYYDLAREAREAITEFEQAKKAGDAEAMGKIAGDADKARLIGLGRMVRSTTKAAAALGDAKVDINSQESMPIEERRAKLKEIEKTEEELYRAAISAFK